ncbi:Hypothetical protein PBC10988_35010 [Planctomycetales bacterium 10988]|nr:Hypothetical protein PBC10988_35010 [Planctomycetales bacterium 10988]
MKNFVIVALVLGLLGEIGAGYWLSQRHASVAEREEIAMKRETDLSQEEAKVSREKQTLASQHDKQELREKSQNQRAELLDSEREELAQQEEEFAEKEKAENEEDEDQVFAFDLLDDHLRRIQESIVKQQKNDRNWPPSGPSQPIEPDSSGDPESKPPTAPEILTDLEERYVVVEKSKPIDESGIAGRNAALKELATHCAQLLSRGSVDSYTIQAAIDVDLENLREFARALELDAAIVPPNLFELLDSSQLKELESLQIKKLASVKQREAKFPGLYRLAIENEGSILEQIQEARSKRPVDLTSTFAKAILQKQLTRQEVVGLRERTTDSARVAAIETRERQLLAKQLAIDGSDIAVRLRLRHITDESHPEFEVLRQSTTRSAVRELVIASSPESPTTLKSRLAELATNPETVGVAVKEFVESRYSDPIKSAELRVMLESTFQATTGNSVTPQSSREFKRWMAAHLTSSEAYELDVRFLSPTIEALAVLQAVNDPRAPHADDARDVEETRSEFRQELAGRKESEKDTPRLTTRFTESKASPQQIYNRLRIIAEYADSEATKQEMAKLAVAGLEFQLTRVEDTRRRTEGAISENARELRALGNLGEHIDPPAARTFAKSSLGRCYESIRLAASDLVDRFPELAEGKTLLNSIEVRLRELRLPKIDSIKAAAPFSDPTIAKLLGETIPRRVSQIESSTSTVSASISRIKQAKMLAERRARLKVDVYGLMTCGRTTQVLEIYKRQGIKATFHDIDSDDVAKAEVRTAILKKNELPLVKVNGISINGRGEELSYESILKSCK